MRLVLMLFISLIFIGLGIYLNQMAWLVIGGILLLLTFIVAAMLAMATAANQQPKPIELQPTITMEGLDTETVEQIKRLWEQQGR